QFRHQSDFNGADPEGYGLRQGAIKDGRRVSGVTAFLTPAINRPNLKLITGTVVARVTLDGKRATGVEMLQAQERKTIKANREVVLSSGAIGSPQILLLSGIGDPASLQRLGITPTHDLPTVGQSYHDHIAANVQMWSDNPESYGVSIKSLPRGAWN